MICSLLACNTVQFETNPNALEEYTAFVSELHDVTAN